MKIKVSLIALSMIICAALHAQMGEAGSETKKYFWNNGITLSPQMLFVGGLDLGVYSNIEYRPFDNPFALLAGMDVRNKWLHLDMSNSGLDTRSLKTHYSIHTLAYLGAGYSFESKKEERNTFYLTATPYVFSFKESATTAFIENTSQNTSFNFNAGITWSNQKVTKKGRTLNFQFYLPIYGSHFLDELRTMNVKMGIAI